VPIANLPATGVAQLIQTLPRFAGSDWLFTINGKRPMRTFSRTKAKMDKASGVTGWTLHDISGAPGAH
jgi:hypothetical protein